MDMKKDLDISVMPSDRTKGSGHKLKRMIFYLNTRKHFLTVRVVKHWNRFLGEGMVSVCGDTGNPAGCSPEQLALSDPA